MINFLKLTEASQRGWLLLRMLLLLLLYVLVSLSLFFSLCDAVPAAAFTRGDSLNPPKDSQLRNLSVVSLGSQRDDMVDLSVSCQGGLQSKNSFTNLQGCLHHINDGANAP